MGTGSSFPICQVVNRPLGQSGRHLASGQQVQEVEAETHLIFKARLTVGVRRKRVPVAVEWTHRQISAWVVRTPTGSIHQAQVQIQVPALTPNLQ